MWRRGAATMEEEVPMTMLQISNTSDSIKAVTRAFIAKHFPQHDIKDDEDIFALGFVNSLFALQLVIFVEKEFAMAVSDEDLSIDNFRSIDAIAALVMRRHPY
jgi:methoxymalonate biosynthesis acyl carrier protein